MATILRGRENAFAYEHNLRTTEKWVEKLVARGELPASALETVMKRRNDTLIPTTTINSRPVAEMVPQYVKSRIPGQFHVSRSWDLQMHADLFSHLQCVQC